MNSKNILIGLIIIIAIFFSYNYLRPMGDGLHKLNKIEYTLKTYEISKENKSSIFKDEKNGKFFIHPGCQDGPGAIFTFKKDGKMSVI